MCSCACAHRLTPCCAAHAFTIWLSALLRFGRNSRAELFSRVEHTNMQKSKISIQIPFFLRFVWIFLGNFGLVSIQITDFSRFVWTIFRKTPENPKKVHTNLQKQAICMDFYKNCFSPVTHGFPIIVWQAEGPQCPFGLLFALCRRAKGKSRAGKARSVVRNGMVGSREAGGRLFTSPEHCGT